MSIGIIFQFGTQTIQTQVEGKNLFFRTSEFMQWGDIDGLRLDKQGVIKEFPDLKDNEDWQKIARQRFKEKIKKMNTEKEIAEYVLTDLTKYGYKPLYWQQSGFRPIKINNFNKKI